MLLELLHQVLSQSSSYLELGLRLWFVLLLRLYYLEEVRNAMQNLRLFSILQHFCLSPLLRRCFRLLHFIKRGTRVIKQRWIDAAFPLRHFCLFFFDSIQRFLNLATYKCTLDACRCRDQRELAACLLALKSRLRRDGRGQWGSTDVA